ncbi:MAG: GspH/FimT family pseudopilin [Porticoccaceae bacterium]|jgi:type IV fimbrial biogenesis protein FimT|nr:prepilin-type N-terminal cleavage/methylation domain-containing protein [Porticoccaceae bacterium]
MDSKPVSPYSSSASARGVTLVEMLVVVAIIGIIALVAMPAFDDYFTRARVKRAAEDVHGLVLQARAEGPIRDQNLSVSVNPGAWCVGVAPNPGCDCTASGAGGCAINVAGTQVRQVVSGTDHPDVTLATTFPGNGTTFSRLRGNASPGGRISLASGDWVLDVRVGVSGRIRLCTPAGANGLAGYPSC